MIKHRKPRGPMPPEQKEKIRLGHLKRREEMMQRKAFLQATQQSPMKEQLQAAREKVHAENALIEEGDRRAESMQSPEPYQGEDFLGEQPKIETDFGTITHTPHPFLEQPPKPAEKVFEHHRCMNCGWIGRDLSFADAIALHAKERFPCKPSLTQPSEKYLTSKMLEQANRNPHRVAQILARQNGSL